MKIKAEAIMQAAKAIIESGNGDEFEKILADNQDFVTVNKELVARVKLAMHRAESGKLSRGERSARSAARSAATDEACCQPDR